MLKNLGIKSKIVAVVYEMKDLLDKMEKLNEKIGIVYGGFLPNKVVIEGMVDSQMTIKFKACSKNFINSFYLNALAIFMSKFMICFGYDANAFKSILTGYQAESFLDLNERNLLNNLIIMNLFYEIINSFKDSINSNPNYLENLIELIEKLFLEIQYDLF